MRGKKRIGLLALSCLFFGALTACGDEAPEEPGTVVPVTPAGGVEIGEDDTTELSSIRLDTTNVTRTFYIGQEFNSDGLVVQRTLLVYNPDKSFKGNAYVPTDDYTVDTTNVDMSNPGKYTVIVTHRHQNNILRQTYDIYVKTALFETTKGLTYTAGLDATFSDGKTIKSFLLNDRTIAGLEDEYDHGYDKESLLSGLVVKAHKFTSDGNSASESSVENVQLSNVEIDDSGLNINAVGTYVIKVTLKGSVLIGGQSVDNTVSTFVIVDVSDPIQSITIRPNGKTQFNQSVRDIDFEEAGWEIRIKPAVSSSYNVPFTNEMFEVEGLDIFNTGAVQTITVKLKDNPDISATTNIKVIASETQDITPYYNLVPTIEENDDTGLPSLISIAGTDFIYGPLPKKIDSQEYHSSGATYTSGRTGSQSSGVKTDAYGSIDFDVRVSIKGSDQKFKITLEKKTELVVFFAATGDEESDLTVYNVNPDGSKGDEVETATTGSIKQRPMKHVFELEAGTYYIIAPGAGIYVHGFIVAMDKD